MRVLVVEDDQRTGALLERGLSAARHRVEVVASGEEACTRAGARTYGAIVLDVMLPGIDGYETCRRLRDASVRSPVLILTARTGIDDRVEGLDAGADDYLAKPYFIQEVLARLRAFERRFGLELDDVLRADGLWLRPSELRAGVGDTGADLTPREAAVLEVLLRHPRQVLTRTAIAESAWDGEIELVSNVVDVHVRALRGKLGPVIETVRGLGYRLAGPVS